MVETVRTSAGRAATAPSVGRLLPRAGSMATVATKGSDSLALVALYECGSQSVIILDFSSQTWWGSLDNFFVRCGEEKSLNLFSPNTAML